MKSHNNNKFLTGSSSYRACRDRHSMFLTGSSSYWVCRDRHSRVCRRMVRDRDRDSRACKVV